AVAGAGFNLVLFHHYGRRRCGSGGGVGFQGLYARAAGTPVWASRCDPDRRVAVWICAFQSSGSRVCDDAILYYSGHGVWHAGLFYEFDLAKPGFACGGKYAELAGVVHGWGGTWGGRSWGAGKAFADMGDGFGPGVLGFVWGNACCGDVGCFGVPQAGEGGGGERQADAS